MIDEPDIAIVGGGMGGGALATALARAGLSVAVLERDEAHVDRVRGEFVAHWGVAEADRLGVLGVLQGVGGVHVTRRVGYDETVSPEQAEAAVMDLRPTHPIGTGPPCASHPGVCEALCASTALAGASVLRGVGKVEVTAGDPPSIAFERDGESHAWRPRLIVGADGRTSSVRRQLGFQMLHDEPHGLLGGMLVDGVPEWPQDLMESGTEGDIYHLVFPQGGDRLRLYVCYDFQGRERFTGTGRERNLLDAFRRSSMPLGEHIAEARPIGPFHSFSN